ncbi:HU family DNA-binding protein [Cupriavidus sp. UYPR2.512]|uniref:HU family DNA-binding protein n=1 Tax=Cupriavidus sp. UYPR2.512 TaxID=1080187 RepID=UPI0003688F82|nr:HU family DNA-binding protein [Cupriavidus sp. UYPR2.512]UIF90884.1 HU family DNA-binding protein [Cupriavidus necator]
MQRNDWIERIAERTGVTKTVAKRMLTAYVDVAEEEIANNGQVRLYAMGVLEVVERKPRVGHNPKTMERIEIAARKVVKFSPGKRVREFVGFALRKSKAEG